MNFDSELCCDHIQSSLALPASYVAADHKLYTCEGWSNLPGSLQPIQSGVECALMTSFLTGIEEMY